MHHGEIRELPDLLSPGDLLVVNDTRVLKARLRARRASGGRVEVLLLGRGPGPVEALLRPGRRLKEGERLQVGEGGEIRLCERLEGGSWRVEARPSPEALMGSAGEIPLPPYLGRDPEAEDEFRYQTVYAQVPGAVAAPTAGLHLSEALLQQMKDRGIERASITLHVGPGTFQPVRPEQLRAGELHAEWFSVPPVTVEAVRKCRERGRRVIAVGTTVARTLESATLQGRVPEAGDGVTRLFLREGHLFRCMDGLLTNFHLPGTSLLMLVCAFGGKERVLEAYREAIRRNYRFYSYGDAMLLL